jgi:hypothetical protein
LQPVLTLPGDTLETTKLMMWVTVLSTSLATGVVARAFAINLAGGMLPIWPLLGVAAGWTVGELFSGAFHWATDNYGRLQTPVVGFACAAFQGHHLAPWTISHRSVYNNVYKIGAATIPLILSALWLLPPAGAAFVATMFYSQLLAQEFHRWTHTPPPLLATAAPAGRHRSAAQGAHRAPQAALRQALLHPDGRAECRARLAASALLEETRGPRVPCQRAGAKLLEGPTCQGARSELVSS